jgi:16S rRNA (cytidine1402-2'-O)-methyltransferase
VGTLFLVATPIGNLDDITLRALRVLAEVPFIAAEDTRSARILLDCHGIRARRITSYNDHNARTRTPIVLDALAAGDVALITDAGTPAISDPGNGLVAAAIDAGHTVVPIPGASAVLASVTVSGLPSRRFHYLGFLPRAGGERRQVLLAASRSGDTLVLYESPHRVLATLQSLLETLGDRPIAVCRELTKLHEEIWRGPISAAIGHFAEPRGEFTLVVEGGPPPEPASSQDDIDAAIAALRSQGATAKHAIAELTRRFKLPRRDAYRRWHA